MPTEAIPGGEQVVSGNLGDKPERPVPSQDDRVFKVTYDFCIGRTTRRVVRGYYKTEAEADSVARSVRGWPAASHVAIERMRRNGRPAGRPAVTARVRFVYDENAPKHVGSASRPSGTDNGRDKPAVSPSDLIVPKGQMTFDAEGQEGARTSRRPSVPDSNSGLTVGRGYDMKKRTAKQIKSELTAIGLSKEQAAAYAEAAGKQGDDAQAFLDANKHRLAELSGPQQKALFMNTYNALESDIAGLTSREEGIRWNELKPAVRDVLVDLRYRGDCTPETRRSLRDAVRSNDVEALTNQIADRDFWDDIPGDRFVRRVQYLERATEDDQGMVTIPPDVRRQVRDAAAKSQEGLKRQIDEDARKRLEDALRRAREDAADAVRRRDGSPAAPGPDR
jgi:hypothetical protein